MTVDKMSKVLNLENYKGNFFEILAESDYSQVAVMTLEPGQDSGEESEHEGDQVVYMIQGEANIIVDGEDILLESGQAFIIPALLRHQIVNNSKQICFFFNIYSPPAY